MVVRNVEDSISHRVQSNENENQRRYALNTHKSGKNIGVSSLSYI